MSVSTSKSGPFEQSFMFHMIRDFFLLLMAVAAVEMGIRYAVLRYDFHQLEPTRVDQAAEQLANDIKSIMLNAGGPTAALTIYPILNRNYNDLGWSIAVEPSAVTVASMKESRNMDVQGLPARWVLGPHQQAAVDLKAEQYCLACHVKARVGDVLGTVTVRSYLDRKEMVWWQEVRLTAGALSLKILIHTVVLFWLLKVRMAPLLQLRSTVSGLAKGVMNLSPRAGVNTEDEFGELARDLNHFLDRIAVVVADLDKMLSEVVSVGGRLGTLNRQLEQQLDGMRDNALASLGNGAERGLATQLVVARETGAFDVLAQTLDEMASAGAAPLDTVNPVRERVARLRVCFTNVAQALNNAAPPVAVNASQSAEYQAFAQSLREMAVLEATMQSVAESGQRLLRRLSADKRVAAD